MPTEDLELSKINRNIIRLAEFLMEIKKENIEIPKQFKQNIKFFISHQYGLDFELSDINDKINAYHRQLRAVQRKLKLLTIEDNQKMNARIATNIVNETEFLLSMYSQLIPIQLAV